MGPEWEEVVSADYEYMREFFVRSASLQLAQNNSIELIRLQTQVLTKALEKSVPTPPADVLDAMRNLEAQVEDSCAVMSARAEEVLQALEKYVRS